MTELTELPPREFHPTTGYRPDPVELKIYREGRAHALRLAAETWAETTGELAADVPIDLLIQLAAFIDNGPPDADSTLED